MIREAVVALTLVTLFAGDASANSNGQIGVNGDLANSTTQTAPLPDDYDPDAYEEPGPCKWWENMVNSMVGSFDWRRTALAVCQDFHNWNEEVRGPKPDGLVAGYEFLDVYVQAWKDRQVARDAAYVIWRDMPMDDLTAKDNARREIEKLNFTEPAKKQMAEETGLLMVLEELENGY